MKTHKMLISELTMILLVVVLSVTSASGVTIKADAGGYSGAEDSRIDPYEASFPRRISTTFNSNNGFQGNMFDLKNVWSQPIELTGYFEGNFDLGATGTIEIWYRSGSYVGFTSDPAGWNLLGTSTLNSQGQDNPTPFDVGNTLTVAPGQTLGLFMYLDGTYGGVHYTDGTGFYTDGIVELTLGVGKGDSPSEPPVYGSTFSPRIWNGTIEYIPEPGMLCLLGLGGLSLLRRRRK
jgi:hypothetical protein